MAAGDDEAVGGQALQVLAGGFGVYLEVDVGGGGRKHKRLGDQEAQAGAVVELEAQLGAVAVGFDVEQAVVDAVVDVGAGQLRPVAPGVVVAGACFGDDGAGDVARRALSC